MSYLINSQGEVVATTSLALKSGAMVRASFEVCEEAIDANRTHNLINARSYKASNAKKYDRSRCEVVAVAINGGTDEFRLFA
jgi:hypothetical protein